MNKKERNFVSAILFIIIIMVCFDLATDSREGVVWWHLLSEASVAIVALIGIFILMRDTVLLRHALADERKQFSDFRQQAEKWQSQSRKYLEGLSQAIDSQLSEWHLTGAEKEVAFLLLKGLSLKEVAEVRQTTEKTARTQSLAIYSKSGLSGRSELAAFFLEDLLVPSREINNTTL